jgi:ribose transport system substrate-binding protein
MKSSKLTFALLALAAAGAITASQAQTKFLVGIVSISPAEANNDRFIRGAQEAAKSRGWEIQVIDAQGAADKANSAIQNLVQRRANAIIDMVFPTTSLRAGLLAAQNAKIPVATWGGGMGTAVVATNGSGGPHADPIVKRMVADMGGKGAVLALTYHTGEVCRDREEIFDGILAKYPDIKVTKNEVRIPGYLQDGQQFAGAWLASNPAGRGPLAVWGCWDDPALGAIATLKQQNRKDVKVYGQNGNADAIKAVQDGWMTATAWQNSFEEGKVLIKTIEDAIKAGASWKAKAVEVPAVIIDGKSVAQFIKDHPESIK